MLQVKVIVYFPFYSLDLVNRKSCVSLNFYRALTTISLNRVKGYNSSTSINELGMTANTLMFLIGF